MRYLVAVAVCSRSVICARFSNKNVIPKIFGEFQHLKLLKRNIHIFAFRCDQVVVSGMYVVSRSMNVEDKSFLSKAKCGAILFLFYT